VTAYCQENYPREYVIANAFYVGRFSCTASWSSVAVLIRELIGDDHSVVFTGPRTRRKKLSLEPGDSRPLDSLLSYPVHPSEERSGDLVMVANPDGGFTLLTVILYYSELENPARRGCRLLTLVPSGLSISLNGYNETRWYGYAFTRGSWKFDPAPHHPTFYMGRERSWERWEPTIYRRLVEHVSGSVLRGVTGPHFVLKPVSAIMDQILAVVTWYGLHRDCLDVVLSYLGRKSHPMVDYFTHLERRRSLLR